MDTLLTFDRAIFSVINHLPHTPFSDWLALFFSGAGSAGVVWVTIGFIIFFKGEKKDKRFFVPILAALLSCWIIVEGLMKFVFARPRPGLSDGALVIASSGWYSFPSSHAAISWALAAILSFYAPRFRWGWFVLAAIISFTRIYLGVHFPLDVVAGAIIGYGMGIFALQWAYASHDKKRKKKHPHT